MRAVKKQPKNWLIYSGLAVQIGSIMYIMSELGQWITKKWEINSKLPTLITCFFGIVAILVLINKKGRNF